MTEPSSLIDPLPIRYQLPMTTDQRAVLIFMLFFAAVTLAILPLYHSPVLMLYLERWGLC